jgi:hypothetical protein
MSHSVIATRSGQLALVGTIVVETVGSAAEGIIQSCEGLRSGESYRPGGRLSSKEVYLHFSITREAPVARRLSLVAILLVLSSREYLPLRS